jgi:phosphopantetheine--protein transferase-like protein
VLTSREERDFHLRFPSKLRLRGGNHLSGDVLLRGPGAVDRAKSEGAGENGDGDYARWVERAAKFLAGRWAAKEAVVKACSWRRLMFDEVMVLKEDGGKRVYGVILDEREVRKNDESDTMRQWHEEPAGQVVQLSISHDGEYATAVCLAADKSLAL